MKLGQNYLVSSTNPQGCERNFNGNATIADSHAMCTAHQLREPSFELFDEWTFRGNPARLDALREILLFIAVKERTVYRYHIVLMNLSFSGCTAANRSFARLAGVGILLDLPLNFHPAAAVSQRAARGAGSGV